jgi:hypothetical protein
LQKPTEPNYTDKACEYNYESGQASERAVMSKILSGGVCAMWGVLALLNFYSAKGWLQATGPWSPAELARVGGGYEILAYAGQLPATVGAMVLFGGGLYHMTRGIMDRIRRGDGRQSTQT